MTWKRRRSRRVAEARMRIGKTQFSSLHQPVCRLACIINDAIIVEENVLYAMLRLVPCETDLDLLQRSVVLLCG